MQRAIASRITIELITGMFALTTAISGPLVVLSMPERARSTDWPADPADGPGRRPIRADASGRLMPAHR